MEIDHPDRVPELVARAFAVAQTGRPGPVVVALPEDMLTAATDAVAGPAVRIPLAAPAAEDLAEIARLLEGARAPLVLAGGGGWGAAGRAGLRAFAESNQLPVVVGFRDQDLLTGASPSYAGDGGLAKTPGVRRLLTESDVILAVGLRFGEILTEGYSLFGIPAMAATLIHAHAADGELNKIATAALPVHAHPDRLMPALAAAPPRRPRPLGGAHRRRPRRLAGEPRHAAAARRARHGRGGAPPAGAAARRRHPDQRRRQLRHLDEQALRLRRGPAPARPAVGRHGLRAPAAIAAKVAHPERTVVCVAGDGDFQMTLPELGCAMQARAWPIILVVNNRSYGTIRMHQERTYPRRVSFTDIENPDFVALAAAYGAHAERVTATADFPAAFARAAASPTGARCSISSSTPRA